MPPHGIPYEDFVAMSGALPVLGLDRMLAHYGLAAAQWNEINAYWTDAIPKDPRLSQFSLLVQNEAARIRAGGPPRARGQAAQTPNDFGREVGSAFNSFGSALGSFVDGAVGGNFAPGTRVQVAWSDGKRYPGTVSASHNEQVEVAFPDGRKVWVPRTAVSAGG